MNAREGQLTRTAIVVAGLLGVLCGGTVERGLGDPSEKPSDGEMVFIPAGEFTMGTSPREAERLAKQYRVHPSVLASETPQRRVFVKAFWIDRYPVTNAQYQKFVEATGHRPPPAWGGSKCPKGLENHPVVAVNWHDAAAYARWAGKRLPTEEEWEKAARGTDGRLYPWGNQWIDEACRPDDGSSPQLGLRTTPVGAFPVGVSPYGVMDLVGNVAEWTSSYSQPPNPERGWAWYVVKGAANAHSLRLFFRCAARQFSAHTSRRHRWLGFRCARDATPEEEAREPHAPPRAPARAAAVVPPFPKLPGPDVEAYGRSKIRIDVTPRSHGARLTVPYFPNGGFGLNLPEQVGVAGYPFGWSRPHTPIQWKVNEDHTEAWYECTFENKAKLTVRLVAGLDSVDFIIGIRNLTDRVFRSPHSNTCLNNHDSPYFEDPERVRTMVWTDRGPTRLLELPTPRSGEILHSGWSVLPPDQPAPPDGLAVRYPFIFVVSRDRQWVVAQAYASARTVANNAHYTCLHSRPVWPDIPPGEERSVLGKLYFLRGGPEELMKRWKEDFE